MFYFLFFYLISHFSSMQLLSHARLFVTPWIAAHQGFLSITNSQSPPKPMSIESVIQLSNPLSSPSPPTLNLSQHQGLFKWVSSLNQGAKVLEFRFNISPTSEHPGLMSFRMDWLDLFADQGTLKSLLQHHSSKYQFFSAQHSSQSNSHISTWPLEKP